MTNYSIGGSSGTTGLSAKTTPAGADLLLIVDSEDTSTPPAGSAGSDKKITFADLTAGIGGSVTSVAVESANGFGGTVADDTTAAAITLTTDVTGLLLGDGTGVSAATAGTDYLAPDGSAADLTSFPTLNQNTTGTAAGLSGTPALPNGTTATTQSAANDSTKVATTAYTDGAVATETSRAETAEALKAPLASPALTGSPTAPTQTTGDSSTKIATDAFVATAVAASNPMTTLGDIIYENSTPAAARLAGNTTSTKKFLTQTGTGSASAAPGWNTIASGDVPTLNQDTSGTAAGLSSTLAIGSGGTGQTTALLAGAALGAPADWYNVKSPVYGATGNGSTDDFTALQAALTAAKAAGGVVYMPEGVYLTSQPLQIGSNVVLLGAGKGITTIRMKSGSWSGVTQVGSINGIAAIMTYGNTTASYIAIRDLTIDGNLTGITALPSWATSGTAAGDNVTNSPLHLNDVTNLLIENVEVINPIGYAVYLQSCVNFTVRGCRAIAGQVSASQGWGLPSQQDGIHLDGVSYGRVDGNYIDTGATGSNVGDDGIALQSLSGACHDVTIIGNTIRADEAAIDLAISGNDIYDVAIVGNDIWQTEESGIVCQPFTSSSATAHNIAVTGNTLRSTCVNGNSQRAAIAFVDDSIQPGGTAAAAWEGVTIAGNVIENITNVNASGIYARYGSDVMITGNVIRSFAGVLGIAVGDNVAATSLPVTNFAVSSNLVDMSSTAVAGCCGVILYDSKQGLITGNTVIGPGGNSSDRVGICPVQASATNVVQVINITNNVIVGWDDGIQEFNAGGGNPDFNTYAGNLYSACGVDLVVLGTHDNIMDPSENSLTGPVTLPAGTSSAAPLNFKSGTNLTSATAGASEYDGVAAYFTNETTSGRGLIPVEQKFRLTAAGGTISTIANYFGSNSNISLVSGGEYEIEIDCWFAKTTSGTVTWTFTNSAAPTAMNLEYKFSPAGGLVTGTPTATALFGEQYDITSTAPTVALASVAAANHHHKFWIRLINGTGTSLKIQATASAGSITPGINSSWKARRVPAANVGTFSA